MITALKKTSGLIFVTFLATACLLIVSCGSVLNPLAGDQQIQSFTDNTVSAGVSRDISSARNGGGTQILLQAFHWNIVKTSGQQTLSGDWYSTINGMLDTIKNAGFTALWLPPPWRDDSYWSSNGVNGGGEGYYWHDFDLNSRYGSAANLATMTGNAQTKGLNILFDIVPNHRDRGRMAADVWGYTGPQWRFGGADDGDPFMSGDSDLNTADGTVYNRIKTALLDLKNNYSADGFRWDFVRGYAGSRVNSWMNDVFGVGNGISVGELWKAPDTQDQLKGWADSANSTAFDFALKTQINTGNPANFKYGLNANSLASWREVAVTFVDNHDTGYSPDTAANDYGQHHWPAPDSIKAKAYAYILTMPGTPTVYWPDYFDWGMGEQISALIKARKAAGVVASSGWTDLTGSYSGFAAKIKNAAGTETLAVSIGSNYSGPGSGWTVMASKAGEYTVWVKDTTSSGWTDAYFRGTPNAWGATRLVSKGNNIWETTQTFTGVANPRFKISRYSDNWNESYPTADYTVTDNHIYTITFNDSTHAISVVDNGSTSTPVTPPAPAPDPGTITLKMTKDVGSGNTLFFTGNVPALSNWGGGVAGKWTTGNVWEVTIPNPGNFSWKVRKGPTGGLGVNWESGTDHNQSNLWPAFNGGF